MIFNQRRGDTTAANQIASNVILNSPMQTIAANPQTILAHPAADVIKSTPSVWDETIVLPESEIGEVAAFARRRGGTWFLAVMNGPKARTVRVPLSFLPSGNHRVAIVRDGGDDPTAVLVEQETAKRDDTFEIKVGAGGGYVARLER
jgi:alpha-glucosidase